MALSNDAKLDELKRLLQRLDRALPPGPQTAFDLPLAPIETMAPQAAPVHAPDRPQRANAPASSPVTHKQRHSAISLRTAFMAAGLSAMVSVSVVALLFVAPQGYKAPWGDGIRAAVEQGYNRFSAQTANASAKPPSKESNPSAQRAEIAALEAAPRLPLPSAPVADEPPSGQAPAGPSAEVIPVKQEQSAAAPPEIALPVTETVPDLPAASPPAAPAPTERADALLEIAAHETSDPESLADLDASQFLRRGLLMLNGGNVGAAQLLLERAADLGSGDAAFTLATTYDGAPGAPRRGAAGRPNADLALRWYDRARELGVAEAGKRLGELKTAGTQVGDGG